MSRLVIANRGEIARRILRTARARGCAVAVISVPEDAGALVRQEADAVLEVSSFLAIPEIVKAAQDWGATLLHPGYGFLSENPEFAWAVEEAGMAFVGPKPDQMRALGNKEAAKALARRLGVPTLEAVPAAEVLEAPRNAWSEFLASRGLRPPFLVKASAGGGGRGMRVVESAAALRTAIQQASSEALAAFGDGTVFLERRLRSPRHVEIQFFGDGQGGGVVLGERECSLQRRYQKVMEESPSPAVDAALREAMGRAALALVEATGYRGAGTAEFLVEGDGSFHFLEVNTRLQVEHPVTEAVRGVDLVDAQLELAEGRWPFERLPEPRGTAIEARILAEDPGHDFLPTTGTFHVYQEPTGPGVRVDSGIREGDRASVHFDSLLAKLIVHGRDRAEAVARLERALQNFHILGCATNLPFLLALSRHPDFRAGRFSTTWIPENFETLRESAVPPAWRELVESRPLQAALRCALAGPARPPEGVAARFAGLALAQDRAFELWQDPADPRHFKVSRGEAVELWACLEGPELVVSALGETWRSGGQAAAAPDGEGVVRAPMAGKVIEVRISQGQQVERGQVLFLVESMKMQMEVTAPRAGRVRTISATPGQILGGPDVLASLDA